MIESISPADQDFLDNCQYTDRCILYYARTFGPGFQSTGGPTTTKDFIAKLNLAPGKRVLDIGCGTGGSAVLMATLYGANVHGIDLSTNMINAARQYRDKLDPELREKLEFSMHNILEVELPEESYDVVYSRDAIMHIKEKDKLFHKIYRWLKPGGTFFVTDYCVYPTTRYTKDFLDYIHNQRRYFMLTVEGYGEKLRSVGFRDVKAEDLKQTAMNVNQRELDAFTANRDSFIKEFSQEEYDAVVKRWVDRSRFFEEGEMTWGAITARKTITANASH